MKVKDLAKKLGWNCRKFIIVWGPILGVFTKLNSNTEVSYWNAKKITYLIEKGAVGWGKQIYENKVPLSGAFGYEIFDNVIVGYYAFDKDGKIISIDFSLKPIHDKLFPINLK